MTEPVGRERAMRFLLGELPDEERDALEERFFVEDDAFAELQEAEDDLTDAYSRGTLSAEQRVRFEARYLQDEPGQARVEFARALRDKRTRHPVQSAPPADRTPRTWGWAAAAVAVLALAGSLVGLVRARSMTVRLEEERKALARTAAEQGARAEGLAAELARLQARVAELEGRLSVDLGRALALTLVPGLARDAQPIASLAIGPDSDRVDLTLRLKSDPHARYRVTIETADGRRVWRGETSAIDASGGRALRVAVPAGILAPGHYVVNVEGVRTGRPNVPHADYVFRVLPKPLPATP